MKSKLHVSVIIPTFNERENVPRIVLQIRAVLTLYKKSFEIIIIDDASSDGSEEVFRWVQKKYTNVHVYVRKGERGLGTAIGFGIQKAKGDIIIGMDVDGNHDPKLLTLLLRTLKSTDLVVGSRFIRGGGMAESFRYAASFIFNGMLRVLFRFPVRDNTSGYYAIHRATLRSLPLKKIFYGYGDYHLRLVYIVAQKGLRIQEIPVMYKRRIYGQSKSRFFIMFFTYLKTAYSLRTVGL